MNETVGERPLPPIYVLDDDDWLAIFESAEALERQIEAPYFDEIQSAFDALGRPVQVAPANDGLHVSVLGDEADLTALQDAVERFFRYWTKSPPPDRSGSPEQYRGDLEKSYADAVFRRRKQRTSRDL